MSIAGKRKTARLQKILALVESIANARHEAGVCQGYRMHEDKARAYVSNDPKLYGLGTHSGDTQEMRDKEAIWWRRVDEQTKKLRPMLNALVRETRDDDRELREGRA